MNEKQSLRRGKISHTTQKLDVEVVSKRNRAYSSGSWVRGPPGAPARSSVEERASTAAAVASSAQHAGRKEIGKNQEQK
jgi:hypothetical protein